MSWDTCGQTHPTPRHTGDVCRPYAACAPDRSDELGEPDADLALGRLRGIRPVNDVPHGLRAPVAAEVAANRARQRHCRVGGTGQGAETLDAALALDHHGGHLTAGHEIQQWLVERLALVLGIVLRQSPAVRSEDRQGHQGVALCLDPAQDFASETTGEAIGLDQDQRTFSLCRHSTQPYPSWPDVSGAVSY